MIALAALKFKYGHDNLLVIGISLMAYFSDDKFLFKKYRNISFFCQASQPVTGFIIL